MKEKKQEKLTRGGRFWSLFPAILIVTMVGGLLALAKIAISDPSFAIERDYYKKAVAWDETAAQSRENARLGWKVELSTEPRGKELVVIAKVKDARGAPIQGADVALEAFANSRASSVVRTRLESGTDASYRGGVALTHPGLWEFRLKVEAHGQRFTEIVRQDVRAGDAS